MDVQLVFTQLSLSPHAVFFGGVQGEMGWLLGGEEPGQWRRNRKDPLSSMGGFEVVMEHAHW